MQLDHNQSIEYVCICGLHNPLFLEIYFFKNWSSVEIYASVFDYSIQNHTSVTSCTIQANNKWDLQP